LRDRLLLAQRRQSFLSVSRLHRPSTTRLATISASCNRAEMKVAAIVANEKPRAYGYGAG
jgi:hypothetical protein